MTKHEWLFNTKAGVVGLLRILKVDETAIGFEYKLADEEQEPASQSK